MYLLNLLMYVLKYHHEVSIKIKSRSQQISILLSINKWVHINLLVCIFVKRQRILDSTWQNFGLLFFIFWELNIYPDIYISTYLYYSCIIHIRNVVAIFPWCFWLVRHDFVWISISMFQVSNNRKKWECCNLLLLNHLAGTRTPIASVNKACDYTCIPYFFI